MADSSNEKGREHKPASPPEQVELRPQTWLDPGTWTGSMKFLPAYIAVAAVAIALIYTNFFLPGSGIANLDTTNYERCVASFNYTFRINAVLSQAQTHSKKSWEVGYAYLGTQEVYNPERSVWRGGKMGLEGLGLRLDEASLYVQPHVKVLGRSLFDEDGGAVGDPAALGIAALQFSRRKWVPGRKYGEAAERQLRLLLEEAPRWGNGVVSHRWEAVEVWSDAVGMFPPFLAYFGVAKGDMKMMTVAVEQIGKYREVLMIGEGKRKGLWRHIVAEGENDDGAWSTGNAWAAYGMVRVRATIAGWSVSNSTMKAEMELLDEWIREILDGAINDDDDASGLLRNYLGDLSWFGETSGTSLLAATVYRMAVMRPDVFAARRYIDWANQKRKVVFGTIDDDGFAKPAVNPLAHKSREPAKVSPEGESFLLLLGTAWRDCVCAGICLGEYLEVTQSVPKVPKPVMSLESVLGVSWQELLAKWQKYFQAP